MSLFSHNPYCSYKDIKVELDLLSYATKFDINKSTTC